MNRYLAKNCLPPPEDIDWCGSAAAIAKPINEAAWCSAGRIVEAIKQFRNHRTYGCGLVAEASLVEDHTQFGEYDGLYVIALDGHCAVVLHIVAAEFCLVADGANDVIESEHFRLSITKALGPNDAKFLRYEGPQRVDWCGAEAVGIATQFARLYKITEL